MVDYILIKPTGSTNWVRARETNLPNEAELQRLMKEHPETLPLEDLGDSVQPLLIVGRESLLGNGYADVIGVDPSGLVTVIECKLDRNPDVKRTVVGQVLGYGAYLWQLSYEAFEEQVVRPYFSSSACHQTDLANMSLAEAMRHHVEEQEPGGEWSEQEFRQNVEDNLRLGRLRLVIVVDKVNDELRRTVEFLNNCTGPQFQCVCAELRHYASEAAALLVPTLIGSPQKLVPQASRTPSKGTEGQFFAELELQTGMDVAITVRELRTWCEQIFDWIHWGTGRTYSSFRTGLHWQGIRVVTLFDIYPNGTVEVCFAFLKSYPPFNEEARRRALLDELNVIPGVRLPADSYNRRPSFSLSALANAEAMDRFKAAFKRAADELRQARDDLATSPAPKGAG